MENSIEEKILNINEYKSSPEILWDEIDKSDPITVLTAIKKGVDIANGVADLALKLKSLFSSSDSSALFEIKKELREINYQLKRLLKGQNEILNKIKNLRFQIREDIEDAQIRNLHTDVQSTAFLLDLQLSGLGSEIDSADSQNVLSFISTQLNGAAGVTLFKPTFWGPGAFPTSSLAFSTWYQMAALTNQPREKIITGIEQFNESFVEALNHAKIAMDEFTEMNSAFLSEIEKISNKKHLLRKKVRTYKTGHERETCTYQETNYRWLVISGSLADGFKGKMKNESKTKLLGCRRIHPGLPGRPNKSLDTIAELLT